MYNRYIPQDEGVYRPIAPQQTQQKPNPGPAGLLSGLFDRLKLTELDSGDLLLLAVLFLLLRENGDEDLILMLALLFIL